MYHSLTGQWLRISPQLLFVHSPVILRPSTMNFNATLARLNRDRDFEAGGIYSKSHVLSIEAFLQTPRAITDVIGTLRQQVRRHNVDHYAPNDLFPELPDVDYHSFTSIWHFISKWGDFAAIFLAIVVVIKFLFFLIELSSRCVDLKQIYGWSRWLFLALVPSFHTMARSHRRPQGEYAVRGEGQYDKTYERDTGTKHRNILRQNNTYEAVSKEDYYSGKRGLDVPLEVYKTAVEEAESAKSRLFPKPTGSAPPLHPKSGTGK
jgi:hypothetical protein